MSIPSAYQIYPILVSAILVSIAGQNAEASSCGNFEFSHLTNEQIYSQFEGAILRIEAGTQVGTGFLINSKQGYVLTPLTL